MRILHLLLLLWALSMAVGCRTLGPDAPAPGGGRAALDAYLEAVFSTEEAHCPGVAVVVTQDGLTIAERQFGQASLEFDVPFTPDHVVRLPYSEGREFMTIAAVLMENDGLLRLDDPIRSYFPKLPLWSQPVTIRDLIHHRSGFVDEWSVLLLMHSSMANRFDRAQFLRLLYEQPAPEVEPGTGYMYSNSDYGLLRLILEQAAAEDLGSYMERRMFRPLRMESSALLADALQVLPRHAPFYAPTRGGYRHMPVKTSPGGDYVICTTARDLARWAHAHSDPESEVAKAVARLLDGEAAIPGLAGHYAFGHTITEVAGQRVVRHEGVLGCNYLTRIPDSNLAVITFGNRFYEPEENLAVVNFLLGVTAKAGGPSVATEPASVPIRHLESLVGQYVSTNIPSWESRTMARELVRVELVEGSLELELSWGRFALVPGDERTFSWRSGAGGGSWGMEVEFVGLPDDSRGFVIRYDDDTEEEFALVRGWTPPRSLIERLAGRYHSAHLDFSWTLLVDEAGGLVLRTPTTADTLLEPFQQDEFVRPNEKFPGMASNVWIRFHANDAGDVTHLTAWGPRLMHHRFDRR